MFHFLDKRLLYLSVHLFLTLGGETEDEKIRVDILENQAMDFRNGFVMLCYLDFVSFCKSLGFLLNLFFLTACDVNYVVSEGRTWS